MAFSYPDAAFIGTLLSQLLLGVYVMVFGLYVRTARARKGPLGFIDYGTGFLFLITVVTIVLDALQQFFVLMRGGAPWVAAVNSTTSTLSLTLDFVSQILLIYRCWTVWGRVIWIAIPPAILSLASYVTGLCVTIDLATVANAYEFIAKDWWVPLGVASMGISLGVNTIVSGLMISKILYVNRLNKAAARASGAPSPASRLGWVATVLLESAIALFFAQLVYLVLYKIEHPAFSLVAGPVTIIYGLNCTAIMVRVGLEATNPNHHTLTTVLKSGDDTTRLPADGDSTDGKGEYSV